ncbi:MAG TPA: radical SAM protein, partial [Candidatus Woesearchaeota archaeon]|nr:radical SAM protein [Candidatus Woesearchaeota archaeon]
MKVIKDFFLKQFVKSIFWITPRLSDRTIIRLTHVAEQLVPEKFKKTVKYVREKWENQHPSVGLVKKILTQLNKRSRNKLAENLFVNALFIGAKKRWKFFKQHGFKPPFFLVISPTMRCNLLCKGCYAGEYTRDEDLDFETVDRIIREAKRLGVYFYTISGGEPYVWEGLFKMFKKHNDCYFQTYTNGTLMNEENAEKLAKVGNVAAAISVEGFERETDLRRGKGVYKRVMKAMDNLRNAGVMFGFSATPTKYNSEILSSERFIDYYINKGCLFGWYFQYIPIGLKPNVD